MLVTPSDAAEDDPLTDRLHRDQFGDARGPSGTATTAWSSTSPTATGSASSATPGSRSSELLEPQVPEGATTTYDWAPYEWARRWPIEEIWKVRKAR